MNEPNEGIGQPNNDIAESNKRIIKQTVGRSLHDPDLLPRLGWLVA